ncbi:MAG TPA: hypothetical protein PKA27_08260 [Fimbriimonadaceae bacterium]|mgnify:CR=1 FL=1|nr:hypothetical protein [Fimbriimonadaceae bacterium]
MSTLRNVGLSVAFLTILACGGGGSPLQSLVSHVTYDDSAFLAQDWSHSYRTEGAGSVVASKTSKGTTPTELSVLWDLVPSGGFSPKGWALCEMIDLSHVHQFLSYKRAVVGIDFSFRAVLFQAAGGTPEVGVVIFQNFKTFVSTQRHVVGAATTVNWNGLTSTDFIEFALHTKSFTNSSHPDFVTPIGALGFGFYCYSESAGPLVVEEILLDDLEVVVRM